jgi:hypothetical protein
MCDHVWIFEARTLSLHPSADQANGRNDRNEQHAEQNGILDTR